MLNNKVRTAYPNDIDVLTITSSNETASDIPGPGRLLGKLYSSIGLRLETCLNSFAERRGMGPQVIACRIKNRWRDASKRDDWVRGEYTKQETRDQRKDMKKLIQYTKSKTESTRKQALEDIADLAYAADNLLELLKGLDAAQVIVKQEAFIWDFCDLPTQISSRIALACVQDELLFKLMRNYEVSLHPELTVAQFIRTNPDQSYLAFRIFTRYMQDLALSDTVERMLDEIEQLTHTSPELIEWEEVDKIFEYWFPVAFQDVCRQFPSFRLQKLLWLMFNYEEKLPQTFLSNAFQSWLIGLEELRDLSSHSLLGSLIDAMLSDTNSEMVIHLLSPRIKPFLNPLDFALGQIAEILNDGAYCILRKPSFDPGRQTDACKVIAALAVSENHNMSRRAVLAIEHILSHDIHSRRLMLDALSCTTSTSFPLVTEIVMSTEDRIRLPGKINRPVCFYRHCNKSGNFVHIWDGSDCTKKTCYSGQKMYIDLLDVLFIDFPRGTPVQLPESAAGLPAGWDRNGQTVFLGEAYVGSKGYACVLTLGAKPENMRIQHWRYRHTGKVIIPDSVRIYILRHPRGCYVSVNGTTNGITEEFYNTGTLGPFKWDFARYFYR